MVEYQWSVRVGTSNRDRATVYVRQHQFDVGAPVQFDQQYEGLTALEYVLGAIGADIVNCLRIVARRRRIEIENVEALVTGRLNNPLTHLGVVGEEGQPGLETINVRVYLSSLEPEELIRQVWAEMQERSPLVCTFRPAINLKLEFQVII